MSYNRPQTVNTVASCIQPPVCVEPTTPEHIKKFRKSYKQQTGVTIVSNQKILQIKLHHGQYDIPKRENIECGKRQAPQDKVQDLMQSQPQGIKQMQVNVTEQRYASHIKEPLAQVPSRNYIWPEQTQQEGFRYGAQGRSGQFTAKEVVFPYDAVKDSEEVRQQYLRTHGNYEVGEQKKRDYNWKIQPNDHRFGKIENRNQDQMRLVLQQEDIKDSFPQTKIITKHQEDEMNFHKDPLGQPRNLGQINAYIRPDTAFGAQRKPNEVGVSGCIRGSATLNEAQPDKDLGRATKQGWRNQTKDGDEQRIFGTPTIRKDINKTGMKSVADHQNYGDEVAGIAILFPQKYSHMGLSEQDFNKLRGRDEIKSIFESIGFKYGLGKFQGIYNRAKQIQGSDDRVSVGAFHMAVGEMDGAQF